MSEYHEVQANGLGVDSTCMLAMHLDREATASILVMLGLFETFESAMAALNRYLPDFEASVFSDPGNEHTHTYENLEYTLEKCAEAGYEFVVVRNEDLGPIFDEHIKTGSIPFFNGGKHVCSMKWKVQPQQAWAEERFGDEPVAWSVGYAADEEARCTKFKAKDIENGDNITRLPMKDLGITREMEEAILEQLGWFPAGKPVRQSACVFCPYTTEPELRMMIEEYPDQFMLLVDMEEKFANVSTTKFEAWNDAGNPLNGRCHNILENGKECLSKPIHGEDLCPGCGCDYDNAHLLPTFNKKCLETNPKGYGKNIRRAPPGMWAANYWSGEGCRKGFQRLIQREMPGKKKDKKDPDYDETNPKGMASIPEWYDYITQEVA